MEFEQERKCRDEIEEYIHSKGIYPEYIDIKHNDIEKGLIVVAQINWGDWKHDHLYYGYLLAEWAKDNGFKILVQDHVTEVTEEDGSDCYSGSHLCSMWKA